MGEGEPLMSLKTYQDPRGPKIPCNRSSLCKESLEKHLGKISTLAFHHILSTIVKQAGLQLELRKVFSWTILRTLHRALGRCRKVWFTVGPFYCTFWNCWRVFQVDGSASVSRRVINNHKYIFHRRGIWWRGAEVGGCVCMRVRMCAVRARL